MAEQNCIFCRIIAGEIPTQVVAQTDDIMVIKDIAPKAPIHYLIMPKKHIKDIASVHCDDARIIANIFFMAQQLAHQLPDAPAFRLISNNGADVGQSVFHMHTHFLAGKKMSDF